VTGDWGGLNAEGHRDFDSSRKCCSVEEVEEDKLGGACSKCGREKKFVQEFGVET
jgi:hypothetical protein